MKNLILIFGVVFLLATSCKTKQNTSQQSEPIPVQTNAQIGKTIGTVSHQYQSTGCHTVIIVKTEDASNPITIIPKDALSAEFDKEGKEIYFDYHPLKMPQPEGCSQGIPAEVTNISAK